MRAQLPAFTVRGRVAMENFCTRKARPVAVALRQGKGETSGTAKRNAADPHNQAAPGAMQGFENQRGEQ